MHKSNELLPTMQQHRQHPNIHLTVMLRVYEKIVLLDKHKFVNGFFQYHLEEKFVNDFWSENENKIKVEEKDKNNDKYFRIK